MNYKQLVKKAEERGYSASYNGSYYFLHGHGKQGIFSSLGGLNAAIME